MIYDNIVDVVERKVFPDLKLTDKGLFDGVSFSFTSLWERSTN